MSLTALYVFCMKVSISISMSAYVFSKNCCSPREAICVMNRLRTVGEMALGRPRTSSTYRSKAGIWSGI